MQSLLVGIKRRKLIQWAAAYLAAAFALLQGLDLLAGAWGITDSTIRTWQALAVVGFFISLVLAWYHGERGRQDVSWSEALLVLALLVGGALTTFLLQRSWTDLPPNSAPAEGEPAEALLRMAVLPPELDRADSAGSGALVQEMFVSALLGRRGLAVKDPFSLNSELRASGEQAPGTYQWLSSRGYRYALRTAIRSVGGRRQVSYALLDTRNGELSSPGSFQVEDEAALPDQVQTAVSEVVAALEYQTGGLSRNPDLQPWLPQRPRNVAAIREFNAGAAYTYQGLPGGGKHYLRALELDPEFIAPRVWIVSGLAARGDTSDAREHVRILRTLQSRASPFEQAMIEWADAVVRGDKDGMTRHLRAALTYSPGNNVLLYSLGATLYQLGRPGEAVAVLAPAVRSEWHLSGLYVLWGVVSILAGKVDGLRPVLENALLISPVDQYLYGPLEAICLFEGDTAAARRYGDQFVAYAGNSEAAEMARLYRSLADLGRARRDTVVALRLLERAVDVLPSDLETRLQLARALVEAGSLGRADELYTSAEKVARADSVKPEVLFLLGDVAAGLGRGDAAASHFTRYLQVAPAGTAASQVRHRLRQLQAAPARQ